MTLAAAGRGGTRLFDVATGRLLLRIQAGDVTSGLAFSPNGGRLAVSNIDRLLYPHVTDNVCVVDIEYDRGIQTERGLSSPIEKVAFSPDDRLLAALSHESRLGVWDRVKNHLLHVFDAPQAAWVDNAAFAFSPDNRQLAYSGSGMTTGEVKLWEIESGKEVGTWRIPPGLNNIIAFPSQDK